VQAPYGADSDFHAEESKVVISLSGDACAVIPLRE